MLSWITRSEKGTRIEAAFEDWAVMEKIITDYKELQGMSDEDAHLAFWQDVRNFAPEWFDGIVNDHGLLEAINSGRLDEIRWGFVLNSGIERTAIEL